MNDFMNIQTCLDIARPLICTMAAGGLLYNGASKSIVGKAAIVALVVYPMISKIIAESPPDPDLKDPSDWVVNVLTFGAFVAIGTGGWVLLQSKFVAIITLLVLDILFRGRLPYNAYDNASLFLVSCAAVCVAFVNIGLVVEACYSNPSDP